jgi:hypothetical protein
MKTIKYLLCVAAAVCVSGMTYAGTSTFSTPSGSTDTAGDPVSASATFTTGANSLTITLSNLLANQKDAGQLVSDLFFTLDAANASITAGQHVGTANEIFVGANGTTTAGDSNASIAWLFSLTAGTFHLDGLSGGGMSGGNTPADLIIGPPGPGGVYTNANGSISGNKPHNPFADQTATFNLTINGISADTVVTGATFSFGTTPGDNVPGGGSMPDSGSTLMLLGAALGSVEVLRRLLLKKRSATV